MRHKPRLRTAAAITLSLGLAGCTTSIPSATDPSPIPSGSSSAVSSSAVGSSAVGSSVPGVGDAAPAADPDADEAAIEVATAAMTAYCRPDLDQETWIRGLYPFISQSAAIGYQTVDPANVPCTSVTAAARVRDGDEAFTMRIWVPTDSGDYSVYVHRADAAERWLAADLVPPGRQ